MKTVCLDTHTLIWYALRPAKLGRAAQRVLREVDAGKASALIPAIVAIELSLLRQAGRRTMGLSELEAVLSAQPTFALLPLDLAQAREFASLDSIADPFDRLVVAAARTARVPLVTADSAIEESALVEVIWD